MNNFNVTEGSGRNLASSGAEALSTMQRFDNSMELAKEEYQQPNDLPMLASKLTVPSRDVGDGIRMPEADHLQPEPISLAHANNNEYMRNESENNGSSNDNQKVSIDYDNRMNDRGNLFVPETINPAHTAGSMTPNQRSLSGGSFGSFSMDEELVPESDRNSSIKIAHTNELSNEESTKEVPNIIKVGNECNQRDEKLGHQTLLTRHDEIPCHSPSPLTTKDEDMRIRQPTENNIMENDGIVDSNDDQLNRYESSSLAVENVQNNMAPDTTPKLPVQNDTNIESRDAHDKQQQQHQYQQKQQQQQQQQHQYQQKQQQQPSSTNEEVIELLEDDEESIEAPTKSHQLVGDTSATSGVKRPRPPVINNHSHSKVIKPGSSLHGYQGHNNRYSQSNTTQTSSNNTMMRRIPDMSSDPQYIPMPPNHIPTWGDPFPPPRTHSHTNRHKRFELSLLNLSEFTITGLPVSFDGKPSSVLGFRKIIKEVSRSHGKAIFERDNPNQSTNGTTNNPSSSSTEQYSSYGEDQNPDGGKWRIPLGAYRAFFSYLQADRMCEVKGIPEDQLKIASLGKARLEKGFPSAQKICSYGVPKGLAKALAPFQRGGVEFVFEKEGRALIADDMGLGKTIQSIASMSIYHDEWPLLILTPSTARYHWAAEFMNWLGTDSSVNRENNSAIVPHDSTNQGVDEEQELCLKESQKPMRLLKESEIHVIVAGKEKVFPSRETRIVICSYGLATSLVESGKLSTGLFRCAIVDESHMLKNIKTKRTSCLVPILHATNRCILLSGTPALARPSELWPQLKILSTERDGWWDNEDDFVRKYVQRTSAIRRAELHTMLTGTVMIRRLKHDILKSLPSKQREKAIIDVVDPEMRQEFHECMKLLRQGKGVMAKIAKKHRALPQNGNDINQTSENNNKELKLLEIEYRERCQRKYQSIRLALQSTQTNDEQKENMLIMYYNQAKSEIDVWYNDRIQEIRENPPKKAEEELDRKTVLNKMYSMTAKAKCPLIAELVGKWLDDPTKGKLCIFAHHLYVLDEIVKLVGLSNAQDSRKRFIRIDGSTSPKERQAQIVAFQNDPDIRIAVLGITAAGVAVTLTASSTVWFTELFWTPALMIQAEDRCHRIGQNAAVKCLYFVATGTLDVLLWDLLEKKFQDLGEFVEGKEKMKIVVRKTFKNVKELQSIFIRSSDDDLESETKQDDNNPTSESEDLIKLETDLQDDIVQLAREEMVMISQGEDEDGTDINLVGHHPSENNHAQAKSGLGQTEDEAICLSDDEEDVSQAEKKGIVSHADSGGSNFSFKKSTVLRNCRFYKQNFRGTSFGIQLLNIECRLVVINNRFGKLKPALGDVLVAVNGTKLPLNLHLNQACMYMKQLLVKGVVELVFVEDEAFVKQYTPAILEMRKQLEAAGQHVGNKKPKNDPPSNSEDVIEILDDD